MTDPDQLSSIDVVELSDFAWTVVDPDGAHEADENLWTRALPRDWPPPRSVDELRRMLAETVSAVGDAANAGRLKIVATLMCFLAEHPASRTLDETVLHEALEEAGAGHAPGDVEKELAARAARLDAHIRARTTRHPEQRAHGHPSGEVGPES